MMRDDVREEIRALDHDVEAGNDRIRELEAENTKLRDEASRLEGIIATLERRLDRRHKDTDAVAAAVSMLRQHGIWPETVAGILTAAETVGYDRGTRDAWAACSEGWEKRVEALREGLRGVMRDGHGKAAIAARTLAADDAAAKGQTR